MTFQLRKLEAHKHSIRFQDQISYIGSENKAYSENDQWYSPEDLAKFKEANYNELKRCRQKGEFKDAKDSSWAIRGYEYLSQNYSKKELRQDHARKVLGSLGDGDNYTCNPAHDGSLGRALALGRSDEQEARKIHQRGPKMVWYPAQPRSATQMQKELPLKNYNKTATVRTPFRSMVNVKKAVPLHYSTVWC